MAHIGVKNRTKDEQVLQWDGRPITFKPGEVRIVSDVPHDHITSRLHVQHKTRKRVIDGEELIENLPQVQGHRLFEIIPLAEALKVASPDEDPGVVAAREASEAKAKERKELLNDLKKELIEDGWQPPEKKEKAGKSGKESK